MKHALVYISHVQDIQRRLAPVLLDAARHFPAVVVTGPRRAGKTTLLRKLFPKSIC
jgi:predicted AAA+ superfamily ATPase